MKKFYNLEARLQVDVENPENGPKYGKYSSIPIYVNTSTLETPNQICVSGSKVCRNQNR